MFYLLFLLTSCLHQLLFCLWVQTVNAVSTITKFALIRSISRVPSPLSKDYNDAIPHEKKDNAKIAKELGIIERRLCIVSSLLNMVFAI